MPMPNERSRMPSKTLGCVVCFVLFFFPVIVCSFTSFFSICIYNSLFVVVVVVIVGGVVVVVVVVVVAVVVVVVVVRTQLSH